MDGDFGKIEGDKLIIKNNIRYNKKYFNINNIMLSNFIIMNGISLCDYRGNNFHIDHINRKTNENYRDNLEIVTIRSNMMNKEGKGYNKIHRKNKFVYNIQYGYKWKYFNLYIGGNSKIGKEDLVNNNSITLDKNKKYLKEYYKFDLINNYLIDMFYLFVIGIKIGIKF